MHSTRNGIRLGFLSLLPLMLVLPVYGSQATINGAPPNSYVTYTESQRNICVGVPGHPNGVPALFYTVSSFTYAGTKYTWNATTYWITETINNCAPEGPQPVYGINYEISGTLGVNVLAQDNGVYASVYNPSDAELRAPDFAPGAPSGVSLQARDSAMQLASPGTAWSERAGGEILLTSPYAARRNGTLISPPCRYRAPSPYRLS